MVAIAILLSIPLRSGGTGSAVADGFAISLNSGELTLTPGKTPRTATTATVTRPDALEQVPDSVETLEVPPPSRSNIETETSSDQGKAEPESDQTPGENTPPLTATMDRTTHKATAEQRSGRPKSDAGEKPLQDAPLKKMGAADRDDKHDLSPLVLPSLSKSAGLDPAGPAKKPSEIQSFPMTSSVVMPLDKKTGSRDPEDQKAIQEKTQLRDASREADKTGISVVEGTRARPLRTEETLQNRKEEPAEKVVKPSPETARNDSVREEKKSVSPLSTQNRLPETVPAASTAGEMISSPTERITEAIPPPPEAAPKTPVPVPVNASSAPTMSDAHDQHTSPEKMTELTVPQKATPIDLTPSHETLPKPEIRQDVHGAASSLKPRPDHREAAKVILPGTEDHQGKTLPLPAAPEAETKTASVPHPEPRAETAVTAKPLTPSVLPAQRSDADTVSDKEKKAVPVSDAAYASSALPDRPKIVHKAREGSKAKNNGSVAEPSPEKQENNIRNESSDKNAPEDAATRAAQGKAVPSAITTSEMPDLLPAPDKQSLPSMPPPGMSRAADIAANLAVPGPETAQTGKDQQKPATPAKEKEKQTETTERQGIPLPEVLLSRDIQVEIFLKGSGIPSVFTRLTKKPYPVPSRRDTAKKEEEVHYISRTKARELGEPGIRLILSVASAEKGVYSFAIENKGKEVYEAAVLFDLYEGREKARTKEYRNITLRPGAAHTFKFILPDTIFWDDDVFSVVMEDSKHITKVQDTSGLVWKEEKDPTVTDQPAPPVSPPVPALLKSY